MPVNITRERKPDARSLEAEAIVRDLARLMLEIDGSDAVDVTDLHQLVQRAVEWDEKHAG